MRVIIFLFCLIISGNIFANDTSMLSAKVNYQEAFKKHEQNLAILKDRKDKFNKAQERYKLAQDNLRSSQEELIVAEANFKDAQKEAKKTGDILKKAGKNLDKEYIVDQD